MGCCVSKPEPVPLLQIVPKVPLFQTIKDDAKCMEEIAAACHEEVVGPNTNIVTKGDVGNQMFFITQGELNVIANDDLVVFTLREGGFFGEISLLYRTQRTATIRTAENKKGRCVLQILDVQSIARVLRRFPSAYTEGVKKIGGDRFEAIVSRSGESSGNTELWDLTKQWSWAEHPHCTKEVRFGVLAVFTSITYTDRHNTETRLALPSEVAYEICSFIDINM